VFYFASLFRSIGLSKTNILFAVTLIHHVRKAADEWKSKLNLLGNPTVVRALVEIVNAKQTQIQLAFKREEISNFDYDRLVASLSSVRSQIAKSTHLNTLKSAQIKTRRLKLLRRSRLLDVTYFDISSVVKDQEFKEVFNIDEFVQNCYLRVMKKRLKNLFEQLLSLFEGSKFLSQWLVKNWENLGSNLGISGNGHVKYEDIKLRIGFLLQTLRNLELFHSDTIDLSRIRPQLKEWGVSIDLLGTKFTVDKNPGVRLPSDKEDSEELNWDDE